MTSIKLSSLTQLYHQITEVEAATGKLPQPCDMARLRGFATDHAMLAYYRAMWERGWLEREERHSLREHLVYRLAQDGSGPRGVVPEDAEGEWMGYIEFGSINDRTITRPCTG